MSVHISRAALLVGALFVGPTAFAACPPGGCQAAAVTRVYPVADLIVPVENLSSSEGRGAKENALMNTICSTVCPSSWAIGAERQGGTIEYHPLTMSIVVQQTPEVHARIAELLRDLRRQMDVQVALEMRIVTASAGTVGQLGLEKQQGEGLPAVAQLDDTQVRLLLEKVQQDPGAVTRQAPKMTMFNGQKATLEINDRQAVVVGIDTTEVAGRKAFRPRVQTVEAGLKIDALPTVSADRRYIRLQLGMGVGRSVRPVPAPGAVTAPAPVEAEARPEPRSNRVQLEQTLIVPDGGTALIGSWTTQCCVRNETVPVIGKVPYLNRLFANVGGGPAEYQFVLVTARLIVAEEEERIARVPAEEAAGEEGSEPEAAPAGATAFASEAEAKEERPAGKDAPADTIPRLYVRDRKFKLTYDVDNVGTSEVKHVEVWWTKDASAWEKFCDDVKPTGKVVIAVKDEGTYGFKLCARSGAGLAAPAPKDSEPPHTWVIVDLTPPVVKLEPVVVSADNGGEVLLKWSACDAHLEARPVKVRYAATPEGPWKDLVVDGPAEGTHRCRAGKLPAACHFRVEAADKAGNVGKAWTTEAVKIDVKVPVIRNVTVKPTP